MGSSGSGSKGSGEARGRGRRVGWLRGPRAVRPGLLVAARGPAEGEKWRAGPVVGRAGWADLRVKLGYEAFSSFLFLFCFSSSLFEFKFGLKFEFQIGAPNSLEF